MISMSNGLEGTAVGFAAHNFSICSRKESDQLYIHDANHPDGEEQFICSFGSLTFQGAEIPQLSEYMT
jgi:hypothetical protein